MNKLKPEVQIFSRFKPANQQIIQEDLRIWPNSLVFRSYRRTWNFFLLGNQIYRKHKFIWLNKKNINHLNIQDLNYGPEAWFLNSLAQSVNWFLGETWSSVGDLIALQLLAVMSSPHLLSSWRRSGRADHPEQIYPQGRASALFSSSSLLSLSIWQ